MSIRIVSFWRKLKDKQWLEKAEDHSLEALIEDVAPVVEIAKELSAGLESRRAS